MAFAIPTVVAKLRAAFNPNGVPIESDDPDEKRKTFSIKTDRVIAIAEVNTTQQASLYSVEVSCKNGFSTNPDLDILVFSNPNAAKDYVESLKFEWDPELRLSPEECYHSEHSDAYVITARKVPELPDDYITGPIGITANRYSEEPLPFIINLADEYINRSYLTIVAVFNEPSAVVEEHSLSIDDVVAEEKPADVQLEDEICIRTYIAFS